MWMKVYFCLCLLLVACTKKTTDTAVVSTKPMLNPVKDSERVIFEAKVTLPKQFKSKVKATDKLIWDLKGANGQVIVTRMLPLPKFPFEVKVLGKDLTRAIPEDSVLLFAARAVHSGKEYLPPEKGELNALAGVLPSKTEVINPHVDQKRYASWAKKNNIIEAKVLNVGSKVDVSLAPNIW